MTSLHLAITEYQRSPYPYHDTQLEWLLEHADEDLIQLADEEGNTPLMLIVRQEMDDWYLLKLLERGADPQAKNRQGMTALMQAMDYNNLDAVKLLLDWYQQQGLRADAGASLEQGRMALFFAVYNGNSSAVDALLLAGAEADGRNQWERTPLMLAAETGQESVMRLLLEHGAMVACVDEERDTALALAAREGHTGCVGLLLEYGADPNTRAKSGCTPLIEVAMCGARTDAARLLLEQGADVHARLPDGRSALSLAAGWGNVELVQVLLDWRAAENRQNLQRAMQCSFRSDTVFLLRHAGAIVGLLEAIAMQDLQQVLHQILVEKADVNARGFGETTPLMEAVFSGWAPRVQETGISIVRVLLEQGADANAMSEEGGTALLAAVCFQAVEIAMLLMEYGAAVNTRGKVLSELEDEETPFTIAPHVKNLEVLREMIRRGADVNTQNSLGQTALMRAAWFGNQDVVALLLEHGADVHLRDPQGRTALMYAALGGDPEIMKVLLSHGSQANVSDTAGITALQLAQGWVGKGIVERLMAAGAKT